MADDLLSPSLAGNDKPWDDYKPKSNAGPWQDYQKPSQPQAATPAATTSPEPALGPYSASQIKPFGTWLNTAMHPVKQLKENLSNIPSDFKKEAMDVGEQGNKQIAAGIGQIKQTYQKGGPWLDYAKGAGKIALGNLDYLNAIPSAFTRSMFGKPVERATGSETAGNIAKGMADLLIPFPIIGKGAGKLPGASEFVSTFTPEATELGAKAGAVTRQATGEMARLRDQAAHGLKKFEAEDEAMRAQSDAATHAWEQAPQGTPYPQTPVREAINRIEKGSPGTDYEKYQQSVYKRVQKELEDLDLDIGIKKNYFPHAYKMGQTTQGAAKWGGKGYSSDFTREREKFPTFEDAFKSGVLPKSNSLAEMMDNYVANATKYIADHRIFKDAHDSKMLKYFMPGSKRIPQGWEEIKSKLGTKNIVIAGRRTGNPVPAQMKAYAPKQYADLLNNYYSQGVTSKGGQWLQQNYQYVANMTNMVKLGMSAYHGTTMTVEAIASKMAEAVSHGFSGQGLEAAHSLLKVPFAPLEYNEKGIALEKAWLGQSTDPKMNRLADLLASAGGRGTYNRHDPTYAFSPRGPFKIYTQAFSQATTKAEKAMGAAKDLARTVKRAGADIASDLKEHPALGVIRQVGRVMDTTAMPLFQEYIPHLKNGAFASTMSGWLKANPHATDEMAQKAAIKIWQSIDNRFGEMVDDNVFWNKTMKQIARGVMVSYSWNLGSANELGGGLKDIGMRKSLNMKSGDWSPRAAYAIALPATSMLMMATYQYLKTGKGPESVEDLISPQSGGTDLKTGKPERIYPFGYMKDVYGVMENPPLQEAQNKMNSFTQFAIGNLSLLGQEGGSDWRGDPIIPGGMKNPDWLTYYMKFVGDSFTPIMMQNQQKALKGTNITPVERFFGMRPAGEKLTDPERYKQTMEHISKQRAAVKKRHDENWDKPYKNYPKEGKYPQPPKKQEHNEFNPEYGGPE